MTLWIVRFAPHGGGQTFDARFKSIEAARKLFNKTGDYPVTERLFVADDFGLEARVYPAHYAILLLNPDKAYESDKALNDANHAAARALGLGTKGMFGSTVN